MTYNHVCSIYTFGCICCDLLIHRQTRNVLLLLFVVCVRVCLIQFTLDKQHKLKLINHEFEKMQSSFNECL